MASIPSLSYRKDTLFNFKKALEARQGIEQAFDHLSIDDTRYIFSKVPLSGIPEDRASAELQAVNALITKLKMDVPPVAFPNFPHLIAHVSSYLPTRDLASFAAVDHQKCKQTQTELMCRELTSLAHNDDVATLEKFLKRHISDAMRIRILHTCVKHGSLDCIRFLLSRGYDLSLIDPSSGANVLHTASCAQSDEALVLLLDHLSLEQRCTFAREKDVKGNTPLLCAIKNKNLACFRHFLALGASPLDENAKNCGVLDFCFRDNPEKLDAEFLKKVFRELGPLRTKSLLNFCDITGNNALMRKYRKLNEECLCLFLANGLDPFHKNKYGESFAHIAADFSPYHLNSFLNAVQERERMEIMKAEHPERIPPLALAVLKGKVESALILLRARSPRFWLDKNGNSLYSYALFGVLSRRGANRDILNLLEESHRAIRCFHALKMLINTFDIPPTSHVLPQVVDKKPIQWDGYQRHFFADDFANFLRNPHIRTLLLEVCTESQYEELFSSIDSSILTPHNYPVILERIQKGQMAIVYCGWAEHSLCLLFYKGYLVICNRGYGIGAVTQYRVKKAGAPTRVTSRPIASFFSLKIQPQLMTLALLEEIDKLTATSATDVSATNKMLGFYYSHLPEVLQATEERLTDLETASPRGGTIGNCSYTAIKASIRAALILFTGSRHHPKSVVKRLGTFHRERILGYFKNTPTNLPLPFYSGVISLAENVLAKRKALLASGTPG